MTVLESINFSQTETLPNVSIHVTDIATHLVSISSSSSRNKYYLGGVMALLLQDHRTMLQCQ